MIAFDPALVHDWLGRSAERHPEKTALVFHDGHYSYDYLNKTSSCLAHYLLSIGVKKQDRIAVFLPNSPEAVISIFGILKAGATFILLENSLKAQKLNYILEDAESNILITHKTKTTIVDQACNDLNMDAIIQVGRTDSDAHRLPWPDLESRQNRSEQIDLPRIIDIDLAAIIYTSGSTGSPKGVMSTHHNMISAARSIIQYLDNEPDDIILSALPLSFDYGLYQLIMSVMFGGTLVLESSFLYLHPILEKIASEKVTGFPLVPTMAAMLLKLQNLSKYRLNHLRYITNTGAALPAEHIKKLTELLPNVRFYSMFGLTECKRVSYMPFEKLFNHPESVGIAMPNSEIKITDKAGDEVLPGETGELLVRGSNVMQGYWKDTAMTERTYKKGRYSAERWLHTGDFFKQDKNGYLYFIGRKDDMIKSRGERVSAREVENVIHDLEGVHEAAVIGIQDDIMGQAIKAFVSLRDNTITDRDILKHCTQNLESFAIPKYIEIIDALPKTPNGKVDKKQLKIYNLNNS